MLGVDFFESVADLEEVWTWRPSIKRRPELPDDLPATQLGDETTLHAPVSLLPQFEQWVSSIGDPLGPTNLSMRLP